MKNKFWRILKKALTVAASLTGAVLFIVVLASAIKKQNLLVCHNVQVKIDYESGLAFLHEDEIKEKVNFLNGGDVIGKRLTDLNFRTLESELRKNPYVQNAEVFVDQSQDIEIDVIQKRPIVRVINNDGVSYYMGDDGNKIPLSDNFTAHVPIALGDVEMHNANRDSVVQAGLYKLIQFVRKDDFLNALVDQVYVNADGQMDIIPKISGHSIRFGLADDKMAEKFDRLKVFYNEGLRRVGWNKYKTIDLRYKDEVVCEKKDDITNKQ